jgi:hypothetical protein
MTRPSRVGERPSASRIDNLGSPHIPVSPKSGSFRMPTSWLPAAGPPPAAADLRNHVAMR